MANNRVKTTEDRVKERIVDLLGVDDEEVTRSADLVDDLGADSLDKVELIMDIEVEFDIEVDDELGEKWRTVGQVIDGVTKIVGE